MYLLDSGVWIGAFNPKDVHHSEAKPILTSGELEKVLLTDHIFGEVLTYARRKIRPEQSVEIAKAILNSEHTEVIFIDEDIFNAAYHIFRRYHQLSFADSATVAVMRDRNISEIVSFDSDFDGVQNISRLEVLP